MHTKTQLVAGLTAALIATFAQAHEYEPLLKAKKYAEAEKAIAAKLAIEPNNPDALVAKTDLILIEAKDNRLDEAVKIAEQCINTNPKNSDCHEALGNVLGTKAIKGGVMSALSYVGKIKDSFKKAVELNPNNFSARSSLLQFYLQAPSLAGGSTSKAKDLIVDTIKVSPAAGALLQANFDAADDNYQRAMNAALAVNTNGNEELGKIQRSVLSNVGHMLINEKKYADADKVFSEIAQRFPDSSIGSFGLGKNLQEQGKQRESIPQFEKSINIDPSGAAFYRLAKAQQAIGEKAKAISNFEKSISFRPELPKKMRSDAEDQIKNLKG